MSLITQVNAYDSSKKLPLALQLLKKEIEEMKAQELKLRHNIVEVAERGALETADQFRGPPVEDSNLLAADLQQELEIVQGARMFAQGLVVSAFCLVAWHLAWSSQRPAALKFLALITLRLF